MCQVFSSISISTSTYPGYVHPRRNHLFAAAHFDDVFGRDEHAADFVLQAERGHAAFQALFDFLFKARIRMDDVPLHCRQAMIPFRRLKILKMRWTPSCTTPINGRQKNSEKENRGDHHTGRRKHVLAGRPGDLLHLHANFVQKLTRVPEAAGDSLSDSGRCSRDCIALRLVVLHFDRLRTHSPSSQHRRSRLFQFLAGEEGFEPPYPVLETGVYRWTDSPKNPKPIRPMPAPITKNYFTSLCAGVLPARIAKLLGLHPFGVLLLVLGRRVVPVFAVAAL